MRVRVGLIKVSKRSKKLKLGDMVPLFEDLKGLVVVIRGECKVD